MEARFITPSAWRVLLSEAVLRQGRNRLLAPHPLRPQERILQAMAVHATNLLTAKRGGATIAIFKEASAYRAQGAI